MKSSIAYILIVPVTSAMGINLLVASLLSRTARKFASEVVISCNGLRANAKSVLEIVALTAGRGSSLILTATGDDAAQAVSAMESVVRAPWEAP